MLIRKCSSYSFSDLVIGIFGSQERASEAKKKYIKIARKSDPFSEQAYWEVDLNKDVEIVNIKVDVVNSLGHILCTSPPSNGKHIYFLVRTSEGLGQENKKQIYFSASFLSIKEMHDNIKDKKHDCGWNSWLEYDSVELNKVRFENNVRHFKN